MTQHNKSVVIIVFEFVFEQWCCNVVINNKPVKSRDVILNMKLINMSAMCLSVGLLFHRMDMIMFNTKTHTYIDYRKPTGFFFFLCDRHTWLRYLTMKDIRASVAFMAFNCTDLSLIKLS